MSSRIGRAWRGMSLACLWLAAAVVATPALAQVRNAGAMPDGRGGIVALGISDWQSCALRSDGEAECWGVNGSSGRATPPAGPFIALSNAMDYTCALRGDGTAACWGSDFSYNARPPEGSFTALASSTYLTCAIQARIAPWSPLESNVQCWDERGGSSLIPPAAPYVAITGGSHHFCGLTGDGRAACWSDGYGTDYGQTNPPAEPFAAISAGAWFTCGLRANGSVACWGANDWGQTTPPAERFTAIAAGAFHACGLRDSGEVQCWGRNTSGQATPPAGRFIAIDADSVNTCGIRSNGRLACWGAGFPSEKPMPVPDTVFGADSMASGGWETCRVGADGQLDCWGYNPYTQAPAGLFNDVGVGERFGCARGEDGLVRCWGDASNGQLLAPATASGKLGVGENHACALLAGDGSAACWGWETNGQTLAPAGTYRDVSAGFVHSCAVRESGSGVCWGYNGEGQVDVPVLPQFLGYQAIQAGERFSCGLRSDGAIACWGMSGDGSAMQSPQGQFRALSVGSYHGCAIRADNGQLNCWGENWSSQLEAPTGTFVSVASGRDYSCAVRSDGTRMCWPSRGITIEPRNLPAMGPNEAYSVALTIQTPTGGLVANPSFTLISGSFPPGITMGSDGVISGASSVPGHYSATIEGSDGAGSATQRRIDLLVDDTPPVLTPYIGGTLGANGWYTSNTSVSWSMNDDSEIRSSQGCFHYLTSDRLPADYTCQATSAGGTSSSTVSVKVDKTAPNTTFTVTPGPTSNQYSPRFEFTGQDATSGNAGFECSLDNAAWSACASPLTLNVGTGSHTLRVRAVDAAGLRDSSPATHTWFMDPTPPTITPFVSGILGWNGWYVSDVQVTFSVDESQSTITSSTGCTTVTVTTDTIGATFTCTATSAGGTSTRTVSLKRDATAPVVTAAATTAPNAAGWYRGDVTVGFGCSDAASGVSACPASQVLSGEGTAIVSTARTVTDAAGNSATSNVVSVKIDRTAPALAPSLPATTLLLNAVTAASANGSDGLSGIGTQSCGSVATTSVGNKTVACTVTDVAGNSASASVGYRVHYAFTGFSSPVQNPPVLNVFKAGRSIPLRWRVTDAQGAPVTNLGSANVDAIAISCPTASENRISTYGGNNAQLQNLGNGYYQLDWSSASSLRGYCRRIELNLGDGELHPALFKFN